MNELLKLESVSAGYGFADVLSDISFSVKKGAFTVVAGPNGSGKSTLVRALGNSIKITGGKISYMGKDISSFSGKSYARELTVVPQESKIIYDYDVEEYISMGRYPYTGFWGSLTGKDNDEIDSVVLKCEIGELRNKAINNLSGGERQMVFLARALCQRTNVLVMDEPLTYLDIKHQKLIMNILKIINGTLGTTVILIAHELNPVLECCSEIILLKEGKIFDKGVTEKIVTRETLSELYETDVNVGCYKGKRMVY
ncbi:ABC transporter ATP-binding protein [bacterium]|jgi:iron complex transport system ATP-binding protein|nr:ABC transporter ATP-binding protein [bacterium]